MRVQLLRAIELKNLRRATVIKFAVYGNPSDVVRVDQQRAYL